MIVAALGWEAGAAIGTVAGALVAGLGLLYAIKRGQEEDNVGRQELVFESRDLARKEAMDLADTRGKAITDLQGAITRIRDDMVKERNQHLEAVDRLQRDLDLGREQSLETQQMLAHGMRALLIWILGELENKPPRVEKAIETIRQALTDADPTPPGQRRQAARRAAA